MKQKYNRYHHNKLIQGYVALASVLVIAVVILTIGISTSLLSINEAQSSLSSMRNEQTVDIVEGCIEDALLYLSINDSLPSQITQPEGICTIVVDLHSGNDWTFTVTANNETQTKNIQISAVRDTVISVISWNEI